MTTTDPAPGRKIPSEAHYVSSKPAPGTIGWIDLTVADADRTRNFYQQVVGWEHEPTEMGGYSDYSMKPAGGAPVAGICHARGINVGLPACWLIYITVADLDQSMERAKALGGKITFGPRAMGGYGRVCVVEDPSGASAALFEHA
jgi:uncharacterized protein